MFFIPFLLLKTQLAPYCRRFSSALGLLSVLNLNYTKTPVRATHMPPQCTYPPHHANLWLHPPQGFAQAWLNANQSAQSVTKTVQYLHAHITQPHRYPTGNPRFEVEIAPQGISLIDKSSQDKKEFNYKFADLPNDTQITLTDSSTTGKDKCPTEYNRQINKLTIQLPKNHNRGNSRGPTYKFLFHPTEVRFDVPEAGNRPKDGASPNSNIHQDESLQFTLQKK
jgi:hypothetical protein